MQPHRQQPTRLPRPWDSPGKNTGVGCHFLLQCRKVKSESEVAQSCPTLSDPMDCSLPGSSACGIFQARVLEWVAIVFSAGNTKLIKIKLLPSPSDSPEPLFGFSALWTSQDPLENKGSSVQYFPDLLALSTEVHGFRPQVNSQVPSQACQIRVSGSRVQESIF